MKPTNTQQIIIDSMKKGQSLSSLLDTETDVYNAPHDFAGDLKNSISSRTISIPTIKAMIKRGLITEKSRHAVTINDAGETTLWHIDYQLAQA